MKKRGQAFLITAVIFITIVSALITIHNYSKKTTFSTFPYIAEEIQIESEKVMDYALIKDNWDKIDDFTKNVSDYVKQENMEVKNMVEITTSMVAISSAVAIATSAFAAAWAEKNIAVAGVGAMAEKEELFGKVLILTVIPETIVLFGFVIAYLILGLAKGG